MALDPFCHPYGGGLQRFLNQTFVVFSYFSTGQLGKDVDYDILFFSIFFLNMLVSSGYLRPHDLGITTNHKSGRVYVRG